MSLVVVSSFFFTADEHPDMFHLFHHSNHLVFKHQTSVIEFLRLRLGELIFGMGPKGSDAERAAAADFYPTGQALSTEDVLAAGDNFRIVWGRHADGTVHQK